MCNALSHHKLLISSGGRIKCEKCWGLWDLSGGELIPYGYVTWAGWRDDCLKRGFTPASTPEIYWSGKNPLPRHEVAMVLVEDLITKNHLQDPAEIRALRNEADQNSDLFIDQVLGRVQL
jgi:hypothetical protein